MFYQRHVKMVYRLCFSYLKSTSDTEDAVQNIFIKLIKNPIPFEGEEHERAWLIRSASNHCKDVLKSAYRKRTEFDVPDLADTSADPGRGDVYEAVLALPEKYKDCVYLHYFEGYKTDEVASILERPASTIRSHLSEARALLHKMLGGDHHDR